MSNAVIQRHPDSAMIYLQHLEKICRERKFDEGIGSVLVMMGQVAADKGDHEQAYAFFLQALPYCQSPLSTLKTLPSVYGSIGNYHTIKGSYDSANHYYYKTLEHLMKYSPEDHRIALVYISLSGLQNRLGQFPKALAYAQLGEDFIRKTNTKNPGLSDTTLIKVNNHASVPETPLVGLLSVKGTAYKGLKEKDNAYRAFSEGIEVARQFKMLRGEQSLLCGMGELLIDMDSIPEAIRYFKTAIKVSSATDPFYGFITPGYGLGKAYYLLGAYEKAEEILFQSIDKAKKSQLQDQLEEAHSILGAVYEATGKYSRALEEQQIVMHLKDSLMNKEKINAINDMELSYKTVQKDKDIAENKLQISQQQNKISQKNIWIGMASFLVFLLTFLLINRYWVNRQKKSSQEKQIYILQQQHEILRKEKEIHHLRNVMQGEEIERARIARELRDGIVQQLLLTRQQLNYALDKAAKYIPGNQAFVQTVDYLGAATRDLQQTAYNLMPETVLQGGLVEALQHYCTQLSGVSTSCLHFTCQGSYQRRDPDAELTLFRIVQEAVQNALKHAQADTINVALSEEEGALSISVQDDGIGFRTEAAQMAKGMGLTSIHTRAASISAGISLKSELGKGTSLKVFLNNYPAV